MRTALILTILASLLAACAAPPAERVGKNIRSGYSAGGELARPSSGDISPTDKEPQITTSASGVSFAKPYVIWGVTYYPMSSVRSFEQEGMASWYGDKEHGGKTSTGETFDRNADTAAHKTLPLGSFVEIENLANGRKVIARVNDRGPFVAGRVIDVSIGVAKKLDFYSKGVTRVRVTLIEDTTLASIDRGNFENSKYAIQIASFADEDSAEKASRSIKGGEIVPATVNGKTYYRVQVQGFKSRSSAESAARELKSSFPGAYVVTLD